MATFKLQILLGVTNPQWKDCRRLDKVVDGRFVSPTYASDSVEAIVRNSSDTFLHDCFHEGLLRLVAIDPNEYTFTATLANGRTLKVAVNAGWFAQAKERALVEAARLSDNVPVVSLSRYGNEVAV